MDSQVLSEGALDLHDSHHDAQQAEGHDQRTGQLLFLLELEHHHAHQRHTQRQKEDGTVDQDTLKSAITIEGEPVSYTNDDSTRITEWLQNNWDKTIGN